MRILILAVAAATFSLPALAADVEPTMRPPGTELSGKTRTLAAGAALLQGKSPLAPMDIYLSGFHAMKEDPAHQLSAHHFCTQVNEDFAQCVLFDGNTRNANLTGIEYIISEKLYAQLPADERQYWHPHNYEILSGQLIAPGIPEAAEKALMKGKMNSYGKTWHVWNTGNAERRGDALPLGEAGIAWSFNRDGEANPGLIETRDRELDVDTRKARRSRTDLQRLAKPQGGVDALKDRFSRQTTPIPGVTDAGAQGEAGHAPGGTQPRRTPSGPAPSGPASGAPQP